MTVLEKMALKFMSASICIIIGSLYNPVDAGSTCTKMTSIYGYSYKTDQYCEYGCCNDDTPSPCCSVSIGLVVGVVFGSLVGVALLIGLICVIIHCSNAHTRRSKMVAPQVVATNTQQMPMQPMVNQPVYQDTQYMQPMQPMVYQPVYQARVAAYPVYPAYHIPSGQPIPPLLYNPPPAEVVPTPIFVEETSPPAANQNK